MFTPWNQALFEKYPCPGIPVVQLLQATCKQNHHIPPGPALCNACPVEFPDSSGTPLGNQQGGPISLGPAPWNDICSLKISEHGEPILADTSIFQWYRAIPLGFFHHSKKVYPKLHRLRIGGAFFTRLRRKPRVFPWMNAWQGNPP